MNRGVSQNRTNHAAATSAADDTSRRHIAAEPRKRSGRSPDSGAPDAAEAPASARTDEIVSATVVRSVALTVIAVIGSILVLQYAQPVLIPVVLGILISYVLGPAVDSLARHSVPR